MSNRSSGIPYDNIRRVQNRGMSIDVHELQKQELDRQSYNDGNSSASSLTVGAFSGKKVGSVLLSGQSSNLTNNSQDKYGFADIELNFDSVHKEGSSDITSGELLWYAAILNNNVEVAGIVEMSLSSFYMPKIYVPTGAPDFFYFKRVFIEVSSISSTQAVLGYRGQKYHFECDVSNISGQGVLLTPLKGAFYFNTPITSLNEFRVKFYVPQTITTVSTMRAIPLPSEIVLIDIVAGSNPVQFTINNTNGINDTTTLGNVGTLGTPGVAVYITGLVSDQTAVDSAVNSVYGVFATTIIDSTTFSIAGISAAAVTTGTQASMYIPKNRISFPMRFTCLRSNITNRIEVSHL